MVWLVLTQQMGKQNRDRTIRINFAAVDFYGESIQLKGGTFIYLSSAKDGERITVRESTTVIDSRLGIN